MKYILLIYGDEREWTSMSEAEMAKVYEAHGAYADAMVKAGVMRGGGIVRARKAGPSRVSGPMSG